MAKRPQKAIHEVPKAVFEGFLNELGKDQEMADVVARLKPLLDRGDLSEKAIKAALLPDDPGGSAL